MSSVIQRLKKKLNLSMKMSIIPRYDSNLLGVLDWLSEERLDLGLLPKLLWESSERSLYQCGLSSRMESSWKWRKVYLSIRSFISVSVHPSIHLYLSHLSSIRSSIHFSCILHHLARELTEKVACLRTTTEAVFMCRVRDPACNASKRSLDAAQYKW